MSADTPPNPGACDCGDAGAFRIDDRRWCHRCHAEMRCALERLAEVVRSAVVARRLSPRAVQALADRIATGPRCDGCAAGEPIRPCQVSGEPWHRGGPSGARRCTAPPAPPAVPQVPPRRGVDFPCEECGKLDGSNLDNGWWRCASCGFPGQ